MHYDDQGNSTAKDHVTLTGLTKHKRSCSESSESSDAYTSEAFVFKLFADL